jgi:hypothetical protein
VRLPTSGEKERKLNSASRKKEREEERNMHSKLHQPPTTPCQYLASPAWCPLRKSPRSRPIEPHTLVVALCLRLGSGKPRPKKCDHGADGMPSVNSTQLSNLLKISGLPTKSGLGQTRPCPIQLYKGGWIQVGSQLGLLGAANWACKGLIALSPSCCAH